ncbi:hypothetical protein ABPG75_009194 [Micractinium tetrahymenae]
MTGSLPARPSAASVRPPTSSAGRIAARPAAGLGARSSGAAPRRRSLGTAATSSSANGIGGGGGGGGSYNGGSGSGSGGGSWGDASDSHNSPLPLGAVLAVSALDWAASRPAAARQRRPVRAAAGLRGAVALGAGLAAAVAASAAAAAAADGSRGKGALAEQPAEPPAGSTAVMAASAAEQQQGAPAAAHGDGSASAAAAPSPPPPTPPPPRRIVLFIEPSPFTYTSGYQTRFRATIREMVAQGCAVLVVTPGRGAAGLLPGGEQQPSEFAGARVVEAGSFPCPGYGSVPLSLGLSPRIFKAVRSWQPDLIHVTSPGTLPIAAWLYSRMLRVPLVASYHTHVPAYLPRLGLGWLASGMWAAIRAIHRAAHLTIAVSPATAADLVGAGACDRAAVKVWPKAVDCEAFSPAHASPGMRRRLAGGGPEGPGPLLLYVGRVSPEKNLALLRPLLERVPGARLAIVGDGPAMEEVKAHLAGTPTTFLGRLSGRELAAAYASADVFVMPSESETLGNVVGEAMASGLPVVAAAAGGVPSVLGAPGATGLLFPPGDAAAAAAAVRRLASDLGARRRMGRAARAEMQRWSWRAATRELLQAHYPAALLAAARQEEGAAGWAAA